MVAATDLVVVSAVPLGAAAIEGGAHERAVDPGLVRRAGPGLPGGELSSFLGFTVRLRSGVAAVTTSGPSGLSMDYEASPRAFARNGNEPKQHAGRGHRAAAVGADHQLGPGRWRRWFVIVRHRRRGLDQGTAPGPRRRSFWTLRWTGPRVPSTMRLLGDWNWWLPSPLQRCCCTAAGRGISVRPLACLLIIASRRRHRVSNSEAVTCPCADRVQFPRDDGPHDANVERRNSTGYLFTQEVDRYGPSTLFRALDAQPGRVRLPFRDRGQPASAFRYDQRLRGATGAAGKAAVSTSTERINDARRRWQVRAGRPRCPTMPCASTSARQTAALHDAMATSTTAPAPRRTTTPGRGWKSLQCLIWAGLAVDFRRGLDGSSAGQTS